MRADDFFACRFKQPIRFCSFADCPVYGKRAVFGVVAFASLTTVYRYDDSTYEGERGGG